MSILWTILNNGTEKSLADWGLANPVIKRISQAQDEFTFKCETANVDSTPVFAFQSTVTLYRNRSVSGGGFSGGTVWFVGLVIQIPRAGAPDQEGMAYKVAGPWWYLDNLPYQQPYANVYLGIVGGLPSYGAKTSTHIFLGQGLTGGTPGWAKVTNGAQISDALTWALGPFTVMSAAPPFQIGSITPNADAPIDEVRDITCAEVIHKMLRWTPDAVTWFDYSTNPPTFKCKRRGELAAVNVPLTGGALRDLSVNPRYDLQASSVQIFYETSSEVNGEATLAQSEDHFPSSLPTTPILQYNAPKFTVDLQGIKATTSEAKLVCADISPTDSNWWLARHPEFDTGSGVSQITSITIKTGGTISRKPNPPTVGGSPVTDKGFTRELINGNIPDWLGKDTQRLTIQVKADVTYANSTKQPDVVLTYQCLSTNATTGTFYNQSISQYPEPIPSGLASHIYASVSVLMYEGTLTLQEEDCSGMIGIGNVINLTGSAISAWTTMNALVQSVEEKLDTGQTVIRFGPPKFLNAGQLVDLLRVNRARVLSNSLSYRSTGLSDSSNQIELGEIQSEKNSVIATAPPNPHNITENTDGTGAVIQHSSASGDCSTVWNSSSGGGTPIVIKYSDAGGRAMSIRTLNVCQDGVPGTIKVLASAFVAD